MIHVGQANVPMCDGVSRRSFLQAGATSMGLSLPTAMQLEAAGAVDPKKQKIKNCITLFLVGSPGHLDTFDMKPESQVALRGEFVPIRTKVPGTQICDLLPQCAKMTDKFAILRSLHHTNAGHSAGDQILFTGYPPGRNPNENIYPSCGSIVAKQLGHLNPELPPYVMIPRHLPGVESAYLGKKYSPFYTQADPANEATWPKNCLLYTSPSPRDGLLSRMPSSA